MSNQNQYQKKSTKNSLLGSLTQTQETKGDIKGSLIETGKDLVIGVIGGGIVGAMIGRASLLVGAAVTGVGHYTKNRLASLFGVGMMAANGFQPKKEDVSGTEDKDMLEGAKERVMAFKDSFSEKLFLDKILKKKEAIEPPPVSGMGEVQYFTYPEGEGQLKGELDLTALDNIEKQVAQSAAAFQEQMRGVLPSEDESMNDIDLSEKNF